MTPASDAATSPHCLVRAVGRPSLAGAPRGLPGLGPVRVLTAGEGLCLTAAAVPLARYDGARIARHLRDLDWVALHGAADESPFDLVDNPLNHGVVISGELMHGLAGVDLFALRLQAVLCAADGVSARGEP
jgi:hypothetical protein